MGEICRDCRLDLLWNKWYCTELVLPSYLILSEIYSEPSQRSMMEQFAKIVNQWIPLAIFVKSFMLDFWLGSEHVFHYHDSEFFSIVNLGHANMYFDCFY